MRRNLKFAGLIASAAVALAACGSSGSSGSSGGVSAASYVKSVCTTATTWRDAIKAAGSKLSSGVQTKSLTNAKTQYVAFVGALVTATGQAETELKAAGSPSVSNGTKISGSLVNVFTSAKGTLGRAETQAAALPTSSPKAFEASASQVVAEIRSSLAGMSAVTPEHNAQLHAAAAKDPTCQSLASGSG